MTACNHGYKPNHHSEARTLIDCTTSHAQKGTLAIQSKFYRSANKTESGFRMQMSAMAS